MKIGVDVMGGDFAPDSIIEGAIDSLKHLSNLF
jgi:fatty acid/phospholipid biosynthesis enzyme